MPTFIVKQDIKTLLCWMFLIILSLAIYVYNRDVGNMTRMLTAITEDFKRTKDDVAKNTTAIAVIRATSK